VRDPKRKTRSPSRKSRQWEVKVVVVSNKGNERFGEAAIGFVSEDGCLKEIYLASGAFSLYGSAYLVSCK